MGDPTIKAFVVGPTGVGKTAVAIAAAERFGAEIINVDSRQIYRRLDIGTAKPTRAELRRVRHHLIDRIDPTEICSAARFVALFREVVGDLEARNRVALAVGGAGLYVDACKDGIHPLPAADPALRARLEARIGAEGIESLHRELASIDPAMAARLAPRDRQRIVRALEVAMLTGRPMSGQLRGPADAACPPDTPLVYLARERRDLYARIEARCEAMMAAGLLREVRSLLQSGVPSAAPGMKSVGYAEWAAYLEGRLDRAEAGEQFVRNSRRYAKRQETWFRNRHPNRIEISIPAGEGPEVTADRVLAAMAACPGYAP